MFLVLVIICLVRFVCSGSLPHEKESLIEGIADSMAKPTQSKTRQICTHTSYCWFQQVQSRTD